MKTLARLAAFVLLLGLAGAAFVWSGAYDVAANRPDAWLDRVAETVADRSIDRRAETIQAPPLDDPAMLRAGVVHYDEMCVTCHGAPGVMASEIGMGLSPSPPDLAQEAGEESPGELFWIVRNGIRMTGMPAFGVTHDDEEIWAIVALLERLPKMSPREYQALLSDAGLAEPPAAGGAAPAGPAAGAPPAQHTHTHGEHQAPPAGTEPGTGGGTSHR